MQTKIQKWGNSLALRIPKPFALEIGLDQNSVVEVSISEGKLLLEPVIVPEYTLHSEVDTQSAVGNEVW